MAYSAPTMATIRNAQRGETRWHISALGKSESLMWSCQVNQALGVDPGVRTFNVDNGALHNGYVFADFETNSGLALYAETVYGTFRVRFKEAVGDFLGAAVEVAENDLALSDGDNIYLYHDYPIFPVFPRIAANGTFYKDYDAVYINENEDPVPVAVMGPDWAGWLTGASVSAALNGADSYAIKDGASISTYLWEVEPAAGASITNANIQATTISFTTTGFWWVKLTVTDDNGKSDYTRALFWVHDASYPPIEVGTASWDNSYSSGVTRLNFNVIDGQADEDTLPAEARLLLWSEDYLDGALSYQGGWTGRQMSKWGGYVVRGRLSRAALRSQFEFEAEGPTSIIDQIKMYSVSLSYKANPSTWWQYANNGITVAHAIHHLWRYHSTLINVRPVILPTSNALRAKYVEDFEEDTLFQQANNLAYLHGIYAKVCCNEAGIIYVEQDAQVYDATTAAGVALTDADWFGDMVIEERPVEPVSFLKLSGFSFAGGASTAIISKAPGGVAWDRGQGNMNVERQILQNQAQSNVIAGRVFAKENNRYPTVSMELPSVLSQTQALRVVPQQWHEVIIDPADTVRGLDWSGGEDLVVREINCEYVPGRCKKTITFEPWTNAIPGVTGDYPTEPSDPTEEPIELPPWPPLPPEPTETAKWAANGDTVNGSSFTGEANEVAPDWENRITGLDSTAFLCMMQLRGWQQIQGTSDPESAIFVAAGVGFLAVTMDGQSTWIDRTPDPNYVNWDTDPEITGSVVIVDIDCPNDASGTIYAWGYGAVSTGQCAVLLKSPDLGLTWAGTSIAGTGGAGGETETWIRPLTYSGTGGAGVINGNCVGCPQTKEVFDELGLCHDGGSSVMIYDIPYSPCSGGGWDVFTSDFYAIWDFGPGLRTALAPTDWNGDGVNFFVHGSIEFTTGPLAFDAVTGWAGIYDEDMNLISGHWLHDGAPFATGSYFGGTSWDASIPGTDDCYIAGLGAWRDDYPVRYLVVHMSVTTDTVPVGGMLTLTNAQLKVKEIPAGWGAVIQPFGLSVDLESGSRIYVTYNDVNGGYMLGVYDSDLVAVRTYELTTNHDVDGAVYPRCIWQPDTVDFGDYVYVFGQNTTGAFIGESTDAGVTVTDRSGALSAETRVSALAAKGDGSGQLAYFYAMTSDLNCWKEDGSWNWTVQGAIPFDPPHRGLSIGYDAGLTALMSNSVPDLVQASTAPQPYINWTDRTGDLATDGGSCYIEWVTP